MGWGVQDQQRQAGLQAFWVQACTWRHDNNAALRLSSCPALRNSSQIPRERKALIERKLNKELSSLEACEELRRNSFPHVGKEKPHFRITANIGRLERRG